MDHGKCSLPFQSQIQMGEKLLQTTAQLRSYHLCYHLACGVAPQEGGKPMWK